MYRESTELFARCLVVEHRIIEILRLSVQGKAPPSGCPVGLLPFSSICAPFSGQCAVRLSALVTPAALRVHAMRAVNSFALPLRQLQKSFSLMTDVTQELALGKFFVSSYLSPGPNGVSYFCVSVDVIYF